MSEDVKPVDATIAAASFPQAQPDVVAAARAPTLAKPRVKPAAKRTVVRTAKAKPAPVAKGPVANKAGKAKVAKTNAVAAKAAAKPGKPVKSARIAAKPAAAKPTVRKSVKTQAAPVRADEFAAQPKAAVDPIAMLKFAAQSAAAQFKDKTMNKTTTLFTDYTGFAKGNLEAVVASGKILFAGFQAFGSSMASDSKAAVETFKTDAKDLAAARTPTEFVQLQSDMFRRNWDTAVACASKNSASVLKLANEAIEPIADRVNLAVDRVRKAA